ncbi:MAG: hypothetical protein J6M10_04390 [Clostridia bacterium]|nr:hypothetical protein [Clostridia bacterium]
MIRFQVLGVRFSLPLLTIIAPILARQLGMEGDLGSVALALGVHELAHLAAAKLAGVAIQEICILPFGGSARMENPYRLPIRQILPVAAAGPAANLGLAVCIAACAHWGWLDIGQAAEFMQPNLILCVFNLIPALPLDGGRMLFCLLRRPLGEKKALAAGLWSGRILAFCLMGASLAGGLRLGVWNLSFILAALFILASGHDERAAQFKSRAQQLSDLLASDFDGRAARLYQMDASARADQALSLLRPREAAWFMLTRKGRPVSMLGARELLDFLLNDGAPETALEELLSSPAQRTGAQ